MKEAFKEKIARIKNVCNFFAVVLVKKFSLNNLPIRSWYFGPLLQELRSRSLTSTRSGALTKDVGTLRLRLLVQSAQ